MSDVNWWWLMGLSFLLGLLLTFALTVRRVKREVPIYVAPPCTQAVGRWLSWWPAAAVMAVMAVIIAAARFTGSTIGSLLFFGSVALTVLLCGLRSPIVATIILAVGTVPADAVEGRIPCQPVPDRVRGACRGHCALDRPHACPLARHRGD